MDWSTTIKAVRDEWGLAALVVLACLAAYKIYRYPAKAVSDDMPKRDKLSALALFWGKIMPASDRARDELAKDSERNRHEYSLTVLRYFSLLLVFVGILAAWYLYRPKEEPEVLESVGTEEQDPKLTEYFVPSVRKRRKPISSTLGEESDEKLPPTKRRSARPTVDEQDSVLKTKPSCQGLQKSLFGQVKEAIIGSLPESEVIDGKIFVEKLTLKGGKLTLSGFDTIRNRKLQVVYSEVESLANRSLATMNFEKSLECEFFNVEIQGK